MNEMIGNPIDAATEKAVEDLIRQHGLKKVQAHLAAIMSRAKWDDWQRVDNLAIRTANRIRREAEKLACKTW